MITQAFAQTLPMAAPPFDWTGIVMAAIIVALVGYIIYIKRKAGMQPGEQLVDKLIGALHSNTTATQAATATPAVTQVDVQAAVAAALAAERAARTPPPSLTVEQVRSIVPTAVPLPAPLLASNPMPVEIPWPNADGTMGKVWLYQGRNFATQQEIIDFDLASAARDEALKHVDHSAPTMTPEQIAAAILAGGDPANRSSWLRPSPTYQWAMMNNGMSSADVTVRINAANGQGDRSIFAATWDK